MSTASSDRRTNDRQQAIREVVFVVARRRAAGEEITDREVTAEHQDLMPELAWELAKLRQIRETLADHDDQQYAVAWERMAADSQHRRKIGSETDDFDPAASGDNSEKSPPLTVIDRYRILGVLGEGGFARVYHAKDEELRRDVAIKVPYRRRGTAPEKMDAYWAEARIVASLDHAAIVPVYDVGRTQDGHCYVVSKLIRGENLSDRLKRLRLSQAEAIQIVLVVADALQYAHSRGLVHRDIKPANILLDALGRPYVVDFGLALTESDSRDGRSYAGTPGYMSPEQARGEAHRVDARSDIFNLGIVLYELLTGQRPFHADSYDKLLEKVLWEDPLPMSHWDGSISKELDRICGKALSKRAANRYESAAQMAEDLRHCTEKPAADLSHPAAAPQIPAGQLTDAVGGQSTGPKIIPRGLRSFDANDADFYLTLVPGPRDRHGVPESIRQWKRRIENPNPAATFPVGLLYGPSGCGKSSLVRAGLLPRLSPHIRSIYLQATAEDTEQRLRNMIDHQFPDLDADLDLADALAALRRGSGLGRGEKLLVVIDQFEQWLHGRTDKDRRDLFSALRQCDGGHVMCLLLVRDDFWLAVGRFVAELEVELVQGMNAALIDLFDMSHARKVLAEFGRAFGQLPDDLRNLEAPQEAFLQRAVAGLAQEDRVTPVRLSLFAEMVKDREWTPDTLRALGGAEGVGVAFLEETFSARTANPRYRMHEKAARSVLEMLLPDRGSDIRGRICSNSELLDMSGYGQKPREFKELMRILDSETRLLTPMDLDALDTHQLMMAPGNQYYQLTHDYLVPSLRQWLTAKQQSTRSGRLELRLAERVRLWNDRPERRQLPSLLEYFAIRMFTRASRWTVSQRNLMQSASRHHLRSLLILLVLLATLLFVGGPASQWLRGVVTKLRTRSAVVWMALGMDAGVWDRLAPAGDPMERTAMIHGISHLVTSPDEVHRQLAKEQDVGVQRGLALVMGELVGALDEQSARTSSLRRGDPIALPLLAMYRDASDPGLHGALRWSLARFQQDDELVQIDRELQSREPLGQRRWYVNSMGHTMVAIGGWTDFLMGAGPGDADGQPDEQQQTRQILRSFCLSSTETTVAQFAFFRRDIQQTGGAIAVGPTSSAVGGNRSIPQTEVTWFQAAAYCNWLSQRERIPRSQWCYQPNDMGEYGPGMRVLEDFYQRRGYRLPTEAEWEYACRAGTTSPRYFGSDPRWLDEYAACGQSGANGVQLIGRYKPNDWGLFDMLGNVSEWCQDVYRVVPDAGEDVDVAQLFVQKNFARVVRGGAAIDPPSKLRAAARDKKLPGESGGTLGFRVARSNL